MNAISNRRRSWILISLGLALVLSAALIMVLRSSPTAQADERPALNFPALESVSPDLLEGLPKEVRERLFFYEFSHGNLAKARGESPAPRVTAYGQVALPASTVSLVKIGNSICTFFEKGVGICEEESRIADDGAVAFSPRGCDRFQLIGIATEGVETMTFASDGDAEAEISVPVVSNVYSADLKASKTQVRGFDGSGRVVFEDVIPLDEFASGTECQRQ